MDKREQRGREIAGNSGMLRSLFRPHSNVSGRLTPSMTRFVLCVFYTSVVGDVVEDILFSFLLFSFSGVSRSWRCRQLKQHSGVSSLLWLTLRAFACTYTTTQFKLNRRGEEEKKKSSRSANIGHSSGAHSNTNKPNTLFPEEAAGLLFFFSLSLSLSLLSRKPKIPDFSMERMAPFS